MSRQPGAAVRIGEGVVLTMAVALTLVAVNSGCASKTVRQQVSEDLVRLEQRAAQPEQAEVQREREVRIAELERLTASLNGRLTDASRAIEDTRRENSELGDLTNALRAELKSERQKLAELELALSKSDAPAKIAEARVRSLIVQLAQVRSELEGEHAQNSLKDTELAELKQRNDQLGSSIDSHRAQIASIETERSDLAEQLAATSTSSTRLTAILGVLLAVFVTSTIVQLWRPRRGESVAAG